MNGDDDGDDIAFSSAALTLAGLGGNDTLTGDTEDDTLIGGIGDDAYTGGGGTDTADLSGAARALNVDLLAGTASGDGSDTFATVENVIGSPGSDVLAGDGRPTSSRGRAATTRSRAAAGATICRAVRASTRPPSRVP